MDRGDVIRAQVRAGGGEAGGAPETDTAHVFDPQCFSKDIDVDQKIGIDGGDPSA